MSRRLTADQERARRVAVSAAMRRSAIRRTCPACKRAGAVRRTTVNVGGGAFITVAGCRWCPWTRETAYEPPKPAES